MMRGHVTAKAPTLSRTSKWRKPVAMLVNGGTAQRQGKSLPTASKKYQIRRGNRHPNRGRAVLAATAFLIGRGLLLLAVEDVQVDGVRRRTRWRNTDDCINQSA